MARARRERHVIVFARSPEYGRVKSRLAREVGALAAWQFYERVSRQLLRRLERDPTWTVWLATTGGPRRDWPGSRRWILQGRGSLAARMEHCLRAVPPGDAVLLGSDIPGVRAEHIRRAFTLFADAPVVFGPAADGGFWLVGLRRVPGVPMPLFPPGVRWSSPHTLADVRLGLACRHALADPLADVDCAGDLAAWRRMEQG